MTTVDVDFNNLARGGLVRVGTRASGFLAEGQIVTAVDRHEDMEFTASVAVVEGGRAYLRMDWC